MYICTGTPWNDEGIVDSYPPRLYLEVELRWGARVSDAVLEAPAAVQGRRCDESDSILREKAFKKWPDDPPGGSTPWLSHDHVKVHKPLKLLCG